MKQKFSFIITLWWVLLLGFLGGMLIWLAPKEPRLSELENRNLAGAPEFSMESILDSSFMSGVERYLADGFFQRQNSVEMSNAIKDIFNMKGENDLADMEEAVNEFMEEAEEINIEEGTSDKDTQSEDMQSADSESTEQNNIDAIDDAEYTFWMDLSDGSKRTVYTFPKEHLDKSINALNAYKDALPEDGEVHFFQIPYGYIANLLIYDEKNEYVGWGCNAEDYMQELAAEGVYLHNGAEILEPYLMDSQKLYFRTDYHWSALGAYYGHAGIRKAMGLPYIEFDDYTYKVYEDFIGAGYGKNPSFEIRSKADRLDVLYPMFPVKSYKIDNLTEQSDAPQMEYGLNSYLAYLGGTIGPWRKIETGADTGRKCVIITDSFGNAFAPYMFAYYDEVHMLDLRPAYFTFAKAGASVREYLQYYGIDDAYIMLSTSSSMNSGYMLEYLTRYLDE